MAIRLPARLAGIMIGVGPMDRTRRTARIASWFAPLADAFVPVALLHGRTAHDGRPATMLVAGAQARVAWLIDRFFAQAPERESLGHVPGWRLPRLLRRMRPSADLTLARVARISAAHLGFDDDYLAVPDWVGMRLSAPFDVAMLARRNHSAADDVRRTRRGNYVAEVSHSAADFAAFHRGMYLTYVRNRHRADAYVRTAPPLRRSFRRGGILWVRRDGERVAGMLFEHRKDLVDIVALGTAGGDLRWTKEGAVAALYVHMIDYAHRSGCRTVDLRGCRPTLADGLLRYKRKWGAALYDRLDVPTSILVHWNRLDETIVEFLTHTPLIFRDHGGLSAVCVAGSDAAADAPSTNESNRFRVPGLRNLLVLTNSPAPEFGVLPGTKCVSISVPAADAGPRALIAHCDR